MSKSISRIYAAAVATFTVVMLITVTLSVALLRVEKSARFKGAVQGVAAARGFQGLVLDSPGLAGLLIGLVEKADNVCIVELELQGHGVQPFVRSFGFDAGKYSNAWPLRLRVRADLDLYKVRAVVLIPYSAFYINFILSLVLGVIISGIVLILLDLRRKREQLRIAERLQEFAQQIAHDIRSPVAALNSIMGHSSRIPQEEKAILGSVIGRITDIANNMLTMNAAQAKVSPNLSDVPCLLSEVIESIVSEKREQLRSHPSKIIIAEYRENSYGLFALVDGSEMKRALSNIIDNAIDATSENGEILVRLERVGEYSIIKIQDNGSGIPADVIPKLTFKGATFGKTSGSGLGLYQVRNLVEKCGGFLDIKSVETEGTLVTMKLPKADSPAWFANELTLSTDSRVAIVDDDFFCTESMAVENRRNDSSAEFF